MKKLLLTLVVAAGVTVSSFGQTSSTTSVTGGGKFSIGLETGLPVGDGSEATSFIIGGSLKYEVPTVTNTFFTISGGYNAFLVKSEWKALGAPSSVNFVPFKAGIKYYAQDGLFLEAQAGIVFSTEKDGGSAFVYSPGIGYTFGTFEAGVRYEGWPKDGATTGQISLRLAARF